jgi:hypothetical protein
MTRAVMKTGTGMTKLINGFFSLVWRQPDDTYAMSASDRARLREAAEQARLRLIKAGVYQAELDAQREIRRRAKAA